MPRSIPPERFDRLLRVSEEIFIANGYARTQMEDVAKALGVGKGTIYWYVESKQALFDFVVRNSGRGHVPVPEVLPVPTPRPGSTLAALQERIDAETAFPRLRAAVSGRTSDPRAELEGVIEELYDLLFANRVGIKLLERCSRDYPELHAVWHSRGRYALLDLLTQYIRRRVRGRKFAPVPSERIAARVFLETISTWAVHIHWDAAPDEIPDVEARASVRHYLTRALLEPGLLTALAVANGSSAVQGERPRSGIGRSRFAAPNEPFLPTPPRSYASDSGRLSAARPRLRD